MLITGRLEASADLEILPIAEGGVVNMKVLAQAMCFYCQSTAANKPVHMRSPHIYVMQCYQTERERQVALTRPQRCQ